MGCVFGGGQLVVVVMLMGCQEASTGEVKSISSSASLGQDCFLS
jgi:hypothetical protein